jgi:hypothetical protein
MHGNDSAIKLYEKNQFQQLRSISDFYYISGKYYSSFVYTFYLSGYSAPVYTSLFTWWNELTLVSWNRVTSFFVHLFSPHSWYMSAATASPRILMNQASSSSSSSSVASTIISEENVANESSQDTVQSQGVEEP